MFIYIEHLGANTIVKLNNKHPFFTKIYAPVLKAAGILDGKDGVPEQLTVEEFQRTARVLHVGLDLLLMANAKEESMDPNQEEKYGAPRTEWGMFLFNLIQTLPTGSN